MADYSEKLRDPRWQKKRLEIFERDRFTCQSCDRNDITLSVHHKYYNDCEPWEYPNDALQTLCEVCHNTVTLLGGQITNELLYDVIKNNQLFTRMVAQLCVLVEKEPDFEGYLKDFLNKQIKDFYSKKKTNG